MKRLRFILIVVVIVAFIVTPRAARAAPEGMFFEDFCGDPIKAVCGTIITSPLGRDTLLLNLAKESARAALSDVGNPDFDRLPAAERAQAVGRFQERLAARLRERVGQVEWDTVQRSVNKVRALLRAAIARAFSGSQTIIDHLTGTLDEVRVLDSGTLRQLLGEARDPNAAILAASYQKNCGAEGLAQNAFASIVTRGPRSDRYFIVCPGLLLSAIGGGADARNNLENLLFVVGHELSHHFDAQKLPSFYAPYAACLAEDLAGQLPGPLPPRLGEISADYWGTEVLLGYLAEKTSGAPQGSPRRERLWALRQGLGALCGSADEGTHPTGDVRIVGTGIVIASTAAVIVGIVGILVGAAVLVGLDAKGGEEFFQEIVVAGGHGFALRCLSSHSIRLCCRSWNSTSVPVRADCGQRFRPAWYRRRSACWPA